MNFDQIRLLIGSAYTIIVVLVFLSRFIHIRKAFTPNFIAKTAIFSSISIILYCVPVFKFALPIFPSFLEIHLDEIPALIAGFAYGPLSGCIVILIKTIVKLPLTNTACVGELADLLYSVAFIIPASILYKKRHSFKGALISLLIGCVFQIAVAASFSTYVMLDFYAFMYRMPKEVILNMTKAINPAVNELNWKFMLMVGVPFNALKDAIVVIGTLMLYKSLHGLIDRIGQKKSRI